MIFKGKKNKNIVKELKLNPYVSQGKIFAYIQENSWLDTDLRYLQALDIGINKVFKEALKKEYLYLEN